MYVNISGFTVLLSKLRMLDKNNSQSRSILLCTLPPVLCYVGVFLGVASWIVFVPACSLSGVIRAARSWWRAVLAAVAWLSWVQGPRGFAQRASCWVMTHVLWQGSCTGLHYGLSGDSLLWLRGLTGQGSVATSLPRSQRWMQHIKDRQGHRYVFIKKKKTLVVVVKRIFKPCFLHYSMKLKVILKANERGLKSTTNMLPLMISDKLLNYSLECEAFWTSVCTCCINSVSSK